MLFSDAHVSLALMMHGETYFGIERSSVLSSNQLRSNGTGNRVVRKHSAVNQTRADLAELLADEECQWAHQSRASG